jgi:hypothetical protein
MYQMAKGGGDKCGGPAPVITRPGIGPINGIQNVSFIIKRVGPLWV